MSLFYPNVSGCASTQAQISLDFEPKQLYQPLKRAGRFALCSKPHGSAKVTQEIFDVSNLDWVVRQVEKMPDRHRKHFWISQATLKPWAKNRRISSIMLLNAIWVDIDIAHPPAGFDVSKIPVGTPEKLAKTLVYQIEELGWPLPSYIISTGGGLCAKYLFDEAMPSAGRARWQSLQTHFVSKIAELELMGYKWPVDHSASDAARILRMIGTHNPKWNQPCRIIWESGKRYDFDYLADYILPYTRDQIREFAAKRALYKEWDENRAAANALGIRCNSNKEQLVHSAMSDELARELWCARFEFGRAVLEHRGGAQVGARNNLFWPMANAIAYSCSGAEQLTKELASLHHSFFKADGWTQAEAMRTAASVKQRLQKGELYKMRTSTFLEKLDVTEAEKKAFSSLLGISKHNQNRANWHEGVMGYEKMKNLELEDYIRETRRRQAEAGKRSVDIRATHGMALPSDLKDKARLMRNSGCSIRAIAKETGASVGIIHKWLKN